ncbi:MAG: DsbC family protein [Arenicellales bacterium]|nr:DsbC family protein [Arenicellales bacterium]
MKRLFTLGLLLLACGSVQAEAPSSDVQLMIQQKLNTFAPGLTVDAVEEAPVDGFYEVSIGARVVYFSHDGKYMFLGELLDTSNQQNLTEQRRAKLIVKKLDKYGEDQMIVIGPKDPKNYVTVFTDVDCPYCAKFHRDVPTLNEAGVQVRYLLFPRTGIAGRSYKRAVGVWCAEDRIESVGIAKEGGEVPFKDCANPVQGHYELGQEIGIRGTPAIILDDGRMIGGYVPPEQLFSQLGIEGQ